MRWETLAFAAIWEGETVATITTEPNKEAAQVHNPMPVILGRHEKSGRSQAEFFGQLTRGQALSPFELRIGLGNSTFDVLNFIRCEIRSQLLPKAREEEGLVLAGKLVCHLQDILHAYAGTMHRQWLCKPFEMDDAV